MDMINLWHLIPNELKLVFLTTLPFIGKGIVLVPFGICKLNFSMEKTVFLCSLGSSIKIGYYFLLIYGAENYLIKKGYLSAQRFEKWLDRTRARHQFMYQCIGIMSLAVVPNIGPGILAGTCLSYVCGVKILRGILVMITGTTVTTYLIALGVNFTQEGINYGFGYFSKLF